jgi:hypothetical protein
MNISPRPSRHLYFFVLSLSVFVSVFPVRAQAGVLTGVPDWSQPFQSPSFTGTSSDWNAWCVPTASANIVGYWDDRLTSLGVGDGQAFPLTNNFGVPDFNDQSADGSMGPFNFTRLDLGWFLDTNEHRSVGPTGTRKGTKLIDIKSGLEDFFESWGIPWLYVRNFGVDTPYMKSSVYDEFDTTFELKDEHDLSRGFTEIKREIDAGRPLLGHFGHGVFQAPTGGMGTAEDPEVVMWGTDPTNEGEQSHTNTENGEVWDANAGLGHTMTIVGYLEAGAGSPHAPSDAVVVLDNDPLNGSPATAQYMALPWQSSPIAGLTSVAPAHLLYVDKDATSGSNNGSSWSDAYVTLQSALADAASHLTSTSQPVEIWVAEGVYWPAGIGGSRTATFGLLNGVAIYGGFGGLGGGDETRRDQRSPSNHITTLSGDLNHDDNSVGRSDNSFHVVTSFNADVTAVLDGFMITAGSANVLGGETQRGAGMLNTGTVNTSNALPIQGPTVRNCTFFDNHALELGGAMVNRDSDVTVVDTLFVGNSAGQVGGGAVWNWRSESLFVNSIFSGNQQFGGNGGGAMAVADFPARIRNCSFSKNESIDPTTGGGGGLLVINFLSGDPNPKVKNSIFWNNSVTQGTVTTMNEDDQIFLHGLTSIRLDYSTVEGLTGAFGGVGNIGQDPLFVDSIGADTIVGTPDDDLRLSNGSPAIDAGNDLELAATVTTDFDGDPRWVGAIDMGAHEHQGTGPGSGTGMGPPVATDTDGDGVGDNVDQCPGHDDNVDVDDDGIPDGCDLCPDEDATGFDVDSDGCIDTFTGLSDLVARLVNEEVISSTMQNSLLSKVGNAEKSFGKENVCTAVNELDAFKNQVDAQTGKKISAEAATVVKDYADSVALHLLSQLPTGETCN